MRLDVDEYKAVIKKERDIYFCSSFDRAFGAFTELGLILKPEQYFCENASLIVEQMRAQCWNDFMREEREFTIYMLKKLIPTLSYENSTNSQAIELYLENYPEHIYQLCLSNTQSRRSRAGKEFEHILELIMMGAGVYFDSQGSIGKDSFVEKGLGKLVDSVSPGVTEFEINKRNCVLISAKTTLRERWQEVPEEMGRTGAREMFLATLDENISKQVLDTLYEANIQVTTTKNNKEKYFKDNDRILTFEELIDICKGNVNKWEFYNYSNEQVKQATDLIKTQLDKHQGHDFVKKALNKRLTAYSRLLSNK